MKCDIGYATTCFATCFATATATCACENVCPCALLVKVLVKFPISFPFDAEYSFVIAVRRRTRDRQVAGSTPGRSAIKSTKSTQPFISQE